MSESKATVSRRYFVWGRVQGVGYRNFVQRTASALGLKGYTRNLDDGRVEVYAAGTIDQLSALAGYLRKGPLFADVRGVDEVEAAPEACDGFRIRY
ncbi:MAG: acylphosphatase [Bryobacteraceae bacterium]|mgnify:FL=1|jgi:Acylphosphatases|nr:acylphosphatase [Bryobacteraceae bacterium]